MDNQYASGALDAGAVVFVKRDGQFLVQGTTLTEGAQVTAFTAKRVEKQVIVGEIISDTDGIKTATFTWANPRPDQFDYTGGKTRIIHDKTTGDYLLRGIGLIPDQPHQVTLRVGTQREVIVGTILDTDDDGVQTATFHWPDPPVLDKPGFTRLENGTWAVKGTGLTPGETITVTTKAGKRQHVTIGEILTDYDGIQTATIADPENDQQ